VVSTDHCNATLDLMTQTNGDMHGIVKESRPDLGADAGLWRRWRECQTLTGLAEVLGK